MARRLTFRQLVVLILALWNDLSQKQIGVRAGLAEDRLSRLLKRERKKEIDDDVYELLLSVVAHRRSAVPLVRACVEALEALDRENGLTEEERALVEQEVLHGARLLREGLSEAALRSRAYRPPKGLPRPEDLPGCRQRAEEQVRLLRKLPRRSRFAVVRLDEEYQHWAFVESCCAESVRQASKSLKAAAAWADLAMLAARLATGPERWLLRVLAYVLAHQANVLRVRGRLRRAEARLEEAKRLWRAGVDPARVLDPGRIPELEGSLRRDQRRFPESLACFAEAAAVGRCPERALMQAGTVYDILGEPERAVAAYLEAEPLVERRGDSRLTYMLRFNLAASFVQLEECSRAALLVWQVRESVAERGDRIESARVTWLEGRIQAGLGRPREARRLLAEARQSFTAEGLPYDAAVALLEEAALLLDEGRSVEVNELALELAAVFASKEVHREALAALHLFEEAALRETATAELARQVLRFLLQARHDQGLRFSSGALGAAAIGVHDAPLVPLSFRRGQATAIGVHDAALVGPRLHGGPAGAAGVHDAARIGAGRAVPEGGEEVPERVEEGEGYGEGEQGASHGQGLRRGSGPGPGWSARSAPAKDKVLPPGGGATFRGFAGWSRPDGKGLKPEHLKARLLRALSGLTQGEMSRNTGIPSSLIDHFEQGDVLPGEGHLERLAAGAGITSADAGELLRLYEAQRLTRRRRVEGAEGVPESLGARLGRRIAVALQRLLRLAPPESAPQEGDRAEAEVQWARLRRLSPRSRLAVVKTSHRFQNWALAERCCEESVRQASRNMKRAAAWARLALETAARVRGPEAWRRRVRGYALAHLANVLRVQGDLQTAEATLEKAKRLWDSGSDPAGLLDPGRLFDLEGSLRRDQRRFPEALACFAKAAAAGCCPERALINRGTTYELTGDAAKALEAYLEAEPLVERRSDPRLSYMLWFNLAAARCQLGDFPGAAELVGRVRGLVSSRGDRIEALRVTWLEGRIQAGLGRGGEALPYFAAAREGFAAEGLPYDAAVALLEESALLLDQGRNAEVKALAPELAKFFQIQGIHREARAALAIFREALEHDAATADLARRILAFLHRARHDEELRFGNGGGEGAC